MEFSAQSLLVLGQLQTTNTMGVNAVKFSAKTFQYC